MSTLVEAARQALEALEQIKCSMFHPAKVFTWDPSIIALRAAIERSEQPVAWMCSDESLVHKGYSRFSRNCQGDWNIPVYTTPPTAPRQWVGLTDEEYRIIHGKNYNYEELALAVEAKLKAKNS